MRMIMYLLIPLILILTSAGGILFIVWRKSSRLKELAEIESITGATENEWRYVVYDFCPEIWNRVKDINIKEHKEMWLVETEKLLRRLRLVSLKMDRFYDSLIKKIRKRTSFGNGASFYAIEGDKNKSETETKTDDKAELKKNEQRLIIEISKNPKNVMLYEELGDLYDKMGDFRDAKESYEAAIELNLNNEELKKKLSKALEEINKTKNSQN